MQLKLSFRVLVSQPSSSSSFRWVCKSLVNSEFTDPENLPEFCSRVPLASFGYGWKIMVPHLLVRYTLENWDDNGKKQQLNMQLLFKMVIFLLVHCRVSFRGKPWKQRHCHMSKAYLPQAFFHHSTHVWSSALIGSISLTKMSWEKRNSNKIYKNWYKKHHRKYQVITLPKFNSSPLKSYRNPIGKACLPTTIFQGLC